MDALFFKITLVFYLAGTILFLAYVVSRKEALSTFSIAATAIGFCAHLLALVTRMIQLGYLPLTNLTEAMSFFSWALVLTFLGVEYRYRIHVLGTFILPLALVSIIPAAALPTTAKSLDPRLQSVWLVIHTPLALLGVVSFAMAFVMGVMYLIQERLLKSKRFNSLYYKLPSLDLLDDLNRKAVYLGFPLLTLGIITGALWGKYVWGSYWTWDPKQTLTLVTWFFYLVVLHGRLTVGWRAKKAAYLAIIGFLGVVFTFVGLNLLAAGRHTFT
jgi:cytochrome c-type biogenesis protein CcsB